MQKTPNLGKPLPLNLFVSHQNFEAVHYSNRLKPPRSGLLKIIDRITDVTYELFRHAGKAIHTHGTDLIPSFLKGRLLFPHIQLYNEQIL